MWCAWLLCLLQLRELGDGVRVYCIGARSSAAAASVPAEMRAGDSVFVALPLYRIRIAFSSCPIESSRRVHKTFADALCNEIGATLDDLREAVTTLEELERTTRRVIGSSHPTTGAIEFNLQEARAALRARETPPDELDEVENA